MQNTISSTDPNGSDTDLHLPTARIDSQMKVLFTNECAQNAGIRIGDSLSAFVRTGELLRHEACYSRQTMTNYDPLAVPQNYACFDLNDYHGFAVMYVEYAYTVGSCTALAMFFRSTRDYLAFTSSLECNSRQYSGILKNTFEKIRMKCNSLLWDPSAERTEIVKSIEDLLSSALLLQKCFNPYYRENGEEQLFELHTLLRTFLAAVVSNTFFVDCDTVLDPDGEDIPIYATVHPECVYLLLTVLLSILNDLSDNRKITITPAGYADDREIRLTTQSTRVPHFIVRASDIRSLIPVTPKKQLEISLAEYIAGYCGYSLDIYRHDPADSLSISIYMKAKSSEPEFKSPTASDQMLGKAITSASHLLALLNAK